MDERLLRYLGLPAAIGVTVGLTWDRLTGLNLIPRLVVTLVLAAIAQEILARTLALSRPKAAMGFRIHKQQNESRKYPWNVFSILTLATAAAIFAGLAWLQTERLVISVLRNEQNGLQSLSLSASWVNAEYVILRLPPLPIECEISEEGASLNDIDWDQPDRALRINNFVFPQSVTVICNRTTPIGQRGIEKKGSADGPYFEPDLARLRILIILMGVSLWLYGLFRLHRLS